MNEREVQDVDWSDHAIMMFAIIAGIVDGNPEAFRLGQELVARFRMEELIWQGEHDQGN